MLKLLILLIACTLVGCTGSRYHNEPHIRKVQPNTSQIAITRSVQLNTAPIWPLKTKGTFLQKVTASAFGRKETFSVHLTLEDQMIEVIAFNDVAGRLYRLKATPWNVLWEGSPNMPSSIKPENILGDFLLINLEAQQLSSLLFGARVYEKGHAAGKTRTIQDRKVLRTINYSLQKGWIWGHVVIKNPAIGYTLDIQTVEQ